MKRFAVITLALCILLLCGCAPANETPTNPSQDTIGTTAEPTNEPTTEQTEPAVVYRHPLTGEILDGPFTTRAVSVVINNLKKCLPQHGISEADIICEAETEGGITRFLAVFTDLSQVPKLGPVRSLRTFFSSLAEAYDSPAVHCGGSQKALKGMHDIKSYLKDWEHIDQMSNGKYFYRDEARKKQGYALEHTLFTTGEKLTAAIAAKGYDTPYTSHLNFGLNFAEEISLQGEVANTVTVTFTGRKTSTFTFDAASGLYKASQYKKDHVDANTGDVMSYRNLIVLQTTHTKEVSITTSRSYYALTGEGEGYFACNGQIVPIKWSRKSVEDPFSYSFADGTPVTLGVGKSYVAVIGVSGAAGVSAE